MHISEERFSSKVRKNKSLGHCFYMQIATSLSGYPDDPCLPKLC